MSSTRRICTVPPFSSVWGAAYIIAQTASLKLGSGASLLQLATRIKMSRSPETWSTEIKLTRHPAAQIWRKESRYKAVCGILYVSVHSHPPRVQKRPTSTISKSSTYIAQRLSKVGPPVHAPRVLPIGLYSHVYHPQSTFLHATSQFRFGLLSPDLRSLFLI